MLSIIIPQEMLANDCASLLVDSTGEYLAKLTTRTKHCSIMVW